jgi:hypothetical protein
MGQTTEISSTFLVKVGQSTLFEIKNIFNNHLFLDFKRKNKI